MFVCSWPSSVYSLAKQSILTDQFLRFYIDIKHFMRSELIDYKAVGIKYYECVFLRYLSDMQIASFLCHIILSCMACLAGPYFYTSLKWHNF